MAKTWYVGVMNDALFIIDKKPCPPTEFVHPGHEPAPNVIATVHNQDDPKETDANAKLIAAAPDLLEACRKAFKALQPFFNITTRPTATQSNIAVMTANDSLGDALAKISQKVEV